MNILKKIFISILFTFTIFLTSINAGELSSDCAIKDGKVDSFNYSICKEDISFRAFYELFPDVWENTLFAVHKFDYISQLKNDPEIITNTQYLKFSILFQEIIGVVLEISMMIIFIILIYQSLVGLLKSVEDGDFLGRDWKATDLIKASSSTTFFLLPVNNLLVINVIIMALATIAISIANYLYGFYLYQLETMSYDSNLTTQEIKGQEEAIENSTNKDKKQNNKMFGHNKFYAYDYIKNLTKIELCRKTSAQYQLEQIQNQINGSNFNSEYSCVAPSIDHARIDNKAQKTGKGFVDNLSFFNYKVTDFQDGDKIKNQISDGIKFGLSELYSCDDEYIKGYDCGELNVTRPDIENNILLTEIIPSTFNTTVNNVKNSLQTNAYSTNYSVTITGWNTLHQLIITELKKIRDNGINGSVDVLSPKFVIAKRIIDEKDYTVLKHASYVYHQLILNHFMTGSLNLTKQSSSIFSSAEVKTNLSGSTNINNFLSFYKEIEDFSNLIQEYQCLYNSKDLDGSVNFLNKLNGGSSAIKNTARCINFKSKEVYGTDNGSIIEKEEKYKKRKSLLKKITTKHNQLAYKIYKNRESIEKSFFESIEDLSNKDIFHTLRQKGWLTFASYLIELNKEINIMNNIKKGFINSISFNIEDINDKFISSDVFDETSGISEAYGSYINKSNALEFFNVDTKDMSQYIDTSNWTKNILQDNLNNLNTGANSISDYMSLLVNPLKPIKESIGLRDDNYLVDVNSSTSETCLTDVSKCPIAKVNPFIQLNNLGHYFINTALSYYVSTTLISVYPKLVKKHMDKNNTLLKDEISKSSGGDIAEKVQEQKPIKSKTLNFFDFLGNILSILNFFVLLMLVGGILMAYAIPIIPFLYFLVGFLSWFLLVIQVFLISPVWAAYLLKYNENKDMVKNFIMNYGLEIILKPFFMVASLIFIWSLYSAIIFFINLTITPLLADMHQDGFILSAISNIILSFVLLYVIFIITERIFSLCNTTYDKIFRIIGVTIDNDDDSQTSEILKYFFFKEAYASLQKGSNKINDVGTNFKTMKNQAKRQAENRLKLWNQMKSKHDGKPREQILEEYNKYIKKNPRDFGTL